MHSVLCPCSCTYSTTRARRAYLHSTLARQTTVVRVRPPHMSPTDRPASTTSQRPRPRQARPKPRTLPPTHCAIGRRGYTPQSTHTHDRTAVFGTPHAPQPSRSQRMKSPSFEFQTQHMDTTRLPRGHPRHQPPRSAPARPTLASTRHWWPLPFPAAAPYTTRSSRSQPLSASALSNLTTNRHVAGRPSRQHIQQPLPTKALVIAVVMRRELQRHGREARSRAVVHLC